jgi:DNA primase
MWSCSCPGAGATCEAGGESGGEPLGTRRREPGAGTGRAIGGAGGGGSSVSPFIKDESVQAVLAAAGIVEVVSGYTSLRKRGATYSGLCPFHQEKTPSFTVSAEKGLYYCFGCGEGGDIVRFLEKMENLSFAEVIEQLGERFGVPVQYEEGAGPDAGRKDRDARLLQAVDKAATFYQRFLWETEKGRGAREYLTKRGLGEEVCRRYRVGFSPAEWRGLHSRATKEGFTDRELEDAGLLVLQKGKTYDRFRGRLMFPLVDHRGRVLGFGGRTLADETPKYLNSPEGPLYQKGRLLYGLYQARKAIADVDEVVVVEGYTDVLGLAQAGADNVVASMGTALTDAQIGLMMRFAKNVTFMFDADRAGTEAMSRSGQLARGHSLRPMVAVLPAGRDPADVAAEGGREAVAKVMEGKISLLGFELRQALARGSTATADGRVRVFEEVQQIMSGASSLKEREEEIPLLADRLRLTPESVALLLRGEPARARSRERAPSGKGQVSLTQRLLGSEADVERDFLVAAACNPDRAVAVVQALTPEHFADPSNREVFVGLRDALALMTGPEDQQAALAELQTRARGGSEAGPLFVRLVMEADQGRYSATLLEELHLRLQDQYLDREISALQAGLDEGGDVEGRERRLVHLKHLRQSVRASLTNLDPEEGQT